ncbi:MAG: N-acetylmuramic acid 6-phosphate etherase [Cytophagales bacterium]|nr:N-acetylmuramic acid 6-phosphate etherase [Cytophagales bacterium]
MDKLITESESNYDDLEKKSSRELLEIINSEDQKVALAVKEVIPQIDALVKAIILRMKEGGRLFYIGAGTSGRLGIVDASECPPTYGVPDDWVIGLIAGGDRAIRKAVEFAEDDSERAWKDLKEFNPIKKDSLIGIAASGGTPYVVGGVKAARQFGLLTGCITNNKKTKLSEESEFPIEIIVGAEVVTGSTRMKAGTSQKLVLNMVSTSVMIGLGRVKGNRMIDMQLSNSKLIERGIKIIMEELGIDEILADELLVKHGSVRKALDNYKKNID